MKIKFIIFVFISIWLALIVRVFFLAIQSNSYYSRLSLQNTIKHEQIAPVRGEIVDVKNRPIAINKLGFKIELAPHLLLKKHKNEFNDEIAFLLKAFPLLNKEKIIKNYKKKDSFYNHDFIDVVHFIPYEKMMPVYSMLNLRKNIKIVPAPKRYYPYKNIAAHMIGYVSRANQKDIDKDPLLDLIGYTGKTGLEKYYNSYLQGTPGEKEIKVNANNQEVEELSYKSPDEDRKLKLNLDMELQKYISKLFEGKVGAIIIMNVDGSVLAAGSYPNYDLNIFVSGMSYKMYDELSSSLDHPFTNKMTHGLYPPGSTIKPLLGLLYISTDLNEHWSVDCRSNLKLGGRIFRCWKKKGHRHTDITKAIRESCDDFFYKGSLVLGNRKMSAGLKRYGFGEKTGVDLPNEFIGVVPSREWKLRKYHKIWSIGETANMAIGQGDFLTTPIQIARETALIATGKLPTPHFIQMIGNEKYKTTYTNVLNGIELKKLPIIQKAMYEVCNSPHGTATNYLHSKVVLAGKTGTAQVIGIKQDIKKRKQEHELSYYKRSHAWFTTYGPYKHPQYVVTVMVEHGGHGGHAAGSIVSDIYNKLLELGYIKKK
ncbi:penicillin-binding protein 2 [Sulfurimonas autotrophica]|uniref:Peptidoglycan glycosyltransferase n=1 Tax=Sulfurimonas autotrophica (strain ATCC BAA-671 / DSM 16294 / JCM 11897 / OK10) TaxID=563040 RepID=E0USM7_SULAO|nr:penicillin-binding protein 2 [Sulfurimonas autotrophica]ADN09190.1 peptidoglycan glycosyltransferase [Sulfurimonas autotrophica DSM 16294]